VVTAASSKCPAVITGATENEMMKCSNDLPRLLDAPLSRGTTTERLCSWLNLAPMRVGGDERKRISRAHPDQIETVSNRTERGCALDQQVCRIFCAEPASTSAENALAAGNRLVRGSATGRHLPVARIAVGLRRNDLRHLGSRPILGGDILNQEDECGGGYGQRNCKGKPRKRQHGTLLHVRLVNRSNGQPACAREGRTGTTGCIGGVRCRICEPDHAHPNPTSLDRRAMATAVDRMKTAIACAAIAGVAASAP
jgi:hypothetical protein